MSRVAIRKCHREPVSVESYNSQAGCFSLSFSVTMNVKDHTVESKEFTLVEG